MRPAGEGMETRDELKRIIEDQKAENARLREDVNKGVAEEARLHQELFRLRKQRDAAIAAMETAEDVRDALLAALKWTVTEAVRHDHSNPGGKYDHVIDVIAAATSRLTKKEMQDIARNAPAEQGGTP